MANFTASGMGGPLQPSPPAPAQGAPMNMAVSAEKRSKLKSYMEGYKDAIESKTAEQLLPNISQISAPAALPPMQPSMQQPMQPPMGQPPMMMNMGGAVDVFDPMFMSNLGSEIMDSNEDNILYEVPNNQVQGFSNGGFTSNISVKEGDTIGGRPEEKDENDYVESILNDYTSIQDSVPSQAFEPATYQGSNVPVGSLETDSNKILEDAIFQNELRKDLGKEPVASFYEDYEMALPGSSQGLTQRYDTAGKTQTMGNPLLGSNFSDFMSGDVNPISKDVSGYYRPADAPAPPEEYFDEGFMKSQKSMFAPLVNKIGMGIMGYSDPYELYKATQATLDPESTQSSIARDRLKDQESAERKLAEEQRMKAMIASMMPQTPKGPTIPNPPIIDLPPEGGASPVAPSPTDYMSASVPSTRVPGFDVSNISPYPQFNMPTSPMLPPIIQPEFFKQLMANMKMPVAAMQEGGNVSSLDNALDNFINTIT